MIISTNGVPFGNSLSLVERMFKSCRREQKTNAKSIHLLASIRKTLGQLMMTCCLGACIIFSTFNVHDELEDINCEWVAKFTLFLGGVVLGCGLALVVPCICV